MIQLHTASALSDALDVWPSWSVHANLSAPWASASRGLRQILMQGTHASERTDQIRPGARTARSPARAIAPAAVMSRRGRCRPSDNRSWIRIIRCAADLPESKQMPLSFHTCSATAACQDRTTRFTGFLTALISAGWEADYPRDAMSSGPRRQGRRQRAPFGSARRSMRSFVR